MGIITKNDILDLDPNLKNKETLKNIKIRKESIDLDQILNNILETPTPQDNTVMFKIPEEEK